MRSVPIGIGVSDFHKLRAGGCWYADKSGLIVELLTQRVEVTLLPRPRRFGKTLAMSMLQHYFEPADEDRAQLFSDLEVWRAGDEVRAHFQQHPVISLSFKDIKSSSWEACLSSLRRVIQDEVTRHASACAHLSGDERRAFDLLAGPDAPLYALEAALVRLSRWLHTHHGQKVVILVDEYDTPVHAGFAHGYYDAVTLFLRNLLSGGFKDNVHLFRGVLTGILRVAKEGLFSGLNNVSDYGILERRYAGYFGFTEVEVERLMHDVGAPERMDIVRSWYNGYLYGGQTIYNPWSVLKYAADLPEIPEPYWKNTSGDEVLRQLILGDEVLKSTEVEDLLNGGSIWKIIDKHTVLRFAYRHADAAWGLLLFSGYLNALEARPEGHRIAYRLALPNVEAHVAFSDAIRRWTDAAVCDRSTVDCMLEAMLRGDAENFAEHLSDFARDVLSYHDTASDRRRAPAERVFHAFLLGILAQLQPRFRVRSNREAGHGRADILVTPTTPGGPGVVIELKRVRGDRGETPEQALDAAMAQVRERDYAVEVRAAGAGEVWVYGAAFDGKRVWVRAER